MSKTPLLFDNKALKLESVSLEGNEIVLVAKTIQSPVPCPRCYQASSRIHSYYKRIVSDLPWQGMRVKIQLLSRRFFCSNKMCKQQIFCERLPKVIDAYSGVFCINPRKGGIEKIVLLDLG